jgi:hypothetical protein
MMTMLAPYGKAELCRIMGIAYASFLRENRDTAFDFPVLLTLGEYDRFGKVPQYNWVWAAKTGYPLKIIPAAGHNANVDNPVVFNAVVEDFLEGLSGKSIRCSQKASLPASQPTTQSISATTSSSVKALTKALIP